MPSALAISSTNNNKHSRFALFLKKIIVPQSKAHIPTLCNPRIFATFSDLLRVSLFRSKSIVLTQCHSIMLKFFNCIFYRNYNTVYIHNVSISYEYTVYCRLQRCLIFVFWLLLKKTSKSAIVILPETERKQSDCLPNSK